MSFLDLQAKIEELQELRKSLSAEFVGDDDDDEGTLAGLAKSMTVNVDGNEFEAIDGTELVKSLMARMDTTENGFSQVMGAALDLLKSQGAEIASLKAEVSRLGGEGRGRKSAVTVHERPGAAPAAKQDEAIPAAELMAKSLSAAEEGKISWREYALVDTSLRAGAPLDRSLLNRITT